jgi:hypothetical protein
MGRIAALLSVIAGTDCKFTPAEEGRLLHPVDGSPPPSGHLLPPVNGLPLSSGHLLHPVDGSPPPSGHLLHPADGLMTQQSSESEFTECKNLQNQTNQIEN